MTDSNNHISSTSLAIVPRTFSEVSILAESIAKSGLLPKALLGKVPDVTMAILAGAELGLPPVAALRSIHVVEGKTVLSADVMVAIVLSRKAAVYFKRISASDVEATYETLRVGETQPQRVTWTWDMAKAAGLNTKDNWRLYRRAMLSARAKAELARDVYPDVLAGCYTPDEIDESERPSAAPQYETKSDVIDADFTETRATQSAEQPATPTLDLSIEKLGADLMSRAYAATTLDELSALTVEAKDALPAGSKIRKQVGAAIRQQEAKLKSTPTADVMPSSEPTATEAA